MKRRDFLRVLGMAGAVLALSPIGVFATVKKHPKYLYAVGNAYPEISDRPWLTVRLRARQVRPHLRVAHWTEHAFGEIHVIGKNDNERFWIHDFLHDENQGLYYIVDSKEGIASATQHNQESQLTDARMYTIRKILIGTKGGS